jgi:hypothetical protein
MSYTPPSSDNANLIFCNSYTPPLGDVADLILGYVSSFLHQICNDENYVYAATTLGLDIYDIETEEKYAYITYDNGFNTVWANDNRVFLGTTNSGVKYFNKTCISGSVINPYDLSVYFSDLSGLTYYSSLTSNYIKYIHGNGDKLLVITNSGIDVVKLDPQSYRSYTTITSGVKGFMTSTGKFYYTVSGTNEWSIHQLNTCLVDWSLPDSVYRTGGGIFAEGITLNDIFITENTASDGTSNTLFVATSSGVYVIDEFDDSYDVYYIE